MTLIKQIERIEKTIQDALDHEPLDVAENSRHYAGSMIILQGLVNELKGKIK